MARGWKIVDAQNEPDSLEVQSGPELETEPKQRGFVPNGELWTDEDKHYILDHSSTMTSQEMASSLPSGTLRTPIAIEKKLRRLLHEQKRAKRTPDRKADESPIQHTNSNLTDSDTITLFWLKNPNITLEALAEMAKENGLDVSHGLIQTIRNQTRRICKISTITKTPIPAFVGDHFVTNKIGRFEIGIERLEKQVRRLRTVLKPTSASLIKELWALSDTERDKFLDWLTDASGLFKRSDSTE